MPMYAPMAHRYKPSVNILIRLDGWCIETKTRAQQEHGKPGEHSWEGMLWGMSGDSITVPNHNTLQIRRIGEIVNVSAFFGLGTSKHDSCGILAVSIFA